MYDAGLRTKYLHNYPTGRNCDDLVPVYIFSPLNMAREMIHPHTCGLGRRLDCSLFSSWTKDLLRSQIGFFCFMQQPKKD